MFAKMHAAGALAAAEAELFKALAHPARARVLGVLASGSASVPDLCEATGLKTTHLAGHLTLLRAQHLVTGKRSGGRLLYSLSFPEVARILSAAEVVLSARAAADADGLAGLTAVAPAVPAVTEPDAGAEVEELIPVLEQSLATRALVVEAVGSLSARTGKNDEEALSELLAEARKTRRSLVQVATEALAEKE
jgi:DNA-binding transcriptional ArsR family regulator